MKILAMFLLSGFFLFPAVGVVPLYAQHYRGMIPDSFQQMQAYDRVGVKSDEQKAIEDLEHELKKLQDKAEDPVLGLETRVKSLEMVNESLTSQIVDLQSQLHAAKIDLHTAETKIETLEDTLRSDEHMTEAMFSLFARTGDSKPAASKPKAPVSKPKPAVDSSKKQ